MEVRTSTPSHSKLHKIVHLPEENSNELSSMDNLPSSIQSNRSVRSFSFRTLASKTSEELFESNRRANKGDSLCVKHTHRHIDG